MYEHELSLMKIDLNIFFLFHDSRGGRFV
jgi:hypothetical protein